MAELPGLGGHCSVFECNILDFLPMKCDACSSILCRNHINYDAHRCSSGLKKNVQVPICPLCSQPVPVSRGKPPDIEVGQHIDRDCQSDPAQWRRRQELQCSLIGCKKRELVRVLCSNCRRNFCLKHRHMNEHDCMGIKENPSLRKLSTSSSTVYSSIASTENDEELARALHAAMNGGFDSSQKSVKRNPDDLSQELAIRLQEEEYQRYSNSSNVSQRCSIS